MKPLAQDFVTVAKSPDPENVYLGSPALIKLPSGKLLATYEWFRPQPHKENIPDQCEVCNSEDGGRTWKRFSRTDILWGSPFVYEKTTYMIGNLRKSRDIVITRSDDEGRTWTPEVKLFEDRYTNAPTTVLFKNGFVYRAFETCPKIAGKGNSVWESTVVAGDLSKDLLDPESWRISPKLSYPGTPPTLSRGLYSNPEPGHITEDGWLEGNVIAVDGGMRVVLRVRMDGEATAGIAAVCDLEDDGENMVYRFEGFYPMPGAQCKFHILYDEVSRLYWTTVTIPTNTMQPRAPLKEIGFKGSPGNERRILMLIYSIDALNWFAAGCVAMSTNPLEAFSYASQLIDGDDLLVLSRTSLGGHNQHDTNLITFHRVENFRRTALDIHPLVQG